MSVRGSVPALTCVAGNGRVRSFREEAQECPLHPGATGKGKAGRVSLRELLMNASSCIPLEMGFNAGGRAGRCEAAGDGW
jgi:hypothetical protein